MEQINWQKMQPLATSRLMLEWISSCSVDKSTTTARQKFGQTAHTLFIVMINVTSSIASVVYCFKFGSIDFNNATFAFMITIGQFGLIYFLFAAFQMRHQIADIFNNLSQIYKKCELKKLFFIIDKIF